MLSLSTRFRSLRLSGLLGRFYLLAATLLFGAGPLLAAPLVFAVHPYLSPTEIEKRFSPLAKYLSTEIGLPITLKVSSGYDEHLQAVGDGRADIAFIGPAELLLVEREFGRRPLLGQLVVNGRPGLSGHLVARNPASGVPAGGTQALAGLRGKRIAFVDAKSTMGYLVPVAILGRAGVAEKDLGLSKFVGSHDNVALGVLAGEFDAGAVKDETFEKYRSRGLYSLHEMPMVPEHVFVASPRIPPEVRQQLQRALLALSVDEPGQWILRGIRSDLSTIAPVEQRDFDALRTLLAMPANSPAKPGQRRSP